MAIENGPSDDEFSLKIVISMAGYVSLPEGTLYSLKPTVRNWKGHVNVSVTFGSNSLLNHRGDLSMVHKNAPKSPQSFLTSQYLPVGQAWSNLIFTDCFIVYWAFLIPQLSTPQHFPKCSEEMLAITSTEGGECL